MFARHAATLVLLVFLACQALPARGQDGDERARPAVPLDAPPFTARLAGFTADTPTGVEFESAENEGQDKVRVLAANRLARWGSYRDRADAPLVVLADGSLLAGDFLRFEAGQLVVYSELFGDLTLRLEQVRGILLQPPADTLQRDRLLLRLQAAARGADRLLLDNGDTLQGVVGPAPRDDLPQESEADEFLWITIPGRAPASVPRSRVTAVIFNPTLLTPVRPLEHALELGWRDGSLLRVSAVRPSDGWLEFSLPCGATLSCDLQSARDEITWLLPLGSAARYLSDGKPLGYKHIPFLSLGWNYGTDQNVLGGRLRSGGQVWSKGLGMHSTSRLAFDLDGAEYQLRADLALDDQAGRRGSVVFRVFAYRGDQWALAYESPVIRGGDEPLPISVDLAGTRRIALIVDAADRGSELDYANWLNARLVAASP